MRLTPHNMLYNNNKQSIPPVGFVDQIFQPKSNLVILKLI